MTFTHSMRQAASVTAAPPTSAVARTAIAKTPAPTPTTTLQTTPSHYTSGHAVMPFQASTNTPNARASPFPPPQPSSLPVFAAIIQSMTSPRPCPLAALASSTTTGADADATRSSKRMRDLNSVADMRLVASLTGEQTGFVSAPQLLQTTPPNTAATLTTCSA